MKDSKAKGLESTGYRCLFEYVKKEGIEPVLNWAQDIKDLPKEEDLIHQTVFGQENALTALAKKNKDIIKYFKEHEKELATLSVTDKNIYDTLSSLLKDFSLINLYLDNATKLEQLRVSRIEFVSDLKSLPRSAYRSFCRIVPLNNAPIYISKCYSDGEVIPKLSEEEANKYNSSTPYFHIPFHFSRESDPSFVLSIEKNGEFNEQREIEIINFGFDGSKLPTIEEVESFDVPKSLVFTNNEK